MCDHCVNRREFAAITTAGLAGGVLGLSSVLGAEDSGIEPWNPDRPPIVTGRPLRVQPILAHDVMAPREKTSWRSWGDIINEPTAAEEMQRIAGELKGLAAKADFPLELLPTAKVTTTEQAANLQKGDFDAVLLYAASNAQPVPPLLRRRSQARHGGLPAAPVGPLVLRLRMPGHALLPDALARVAAGATRADNHGGTTLDDVVVDDYDEVLWRLRALYGLKNFVGQRMLALGGRWANGTAAAPEVARTRYKLDIVPIEYEELAVPAEGHPVGRGTPEAVRRLDRSLPGHARHEAGDEEGVRPAGVRRVHGLPAMAAGVPGPGDHRRLVHGDDLRRVEHGRLHAA